MMEDERMTDIQNSARWMLGANQILIVIAFGAFTGYLSRYYPPSSSVTITVITFACICGFLFPATRRILLLVGIFYGLGLVLSHLN